MKLSDIAKKPKLIKITIDDEEIVKEFGEPIEFWSYDRQPLEVFLKLSSIDPDNQGEIINCVKDLILDEAGKPVLADNHVLPAKVLLKVINSVVESLGN